MYLLRLGVVGVVVGVLFAPAAARDAPGRDAPAEVRVRLLERAAPRVLVVSAERGLSFFAGTGPDNVLAELAPDETATIRMRGDDLYVQAGEASFFALSLRLTPRDDAPLRVDVTDGQATPGARRYPGRLTLEIDRTDAPVLKLINHVALDDYVACVVARAYGFDDLEGAKAMAVLVRTYALRAAETFGADYDLIDHYTAQQYDGVDPLTDAARRAARETQGEVLTYNNERDVRREGDAYLFTGRGDGQRVGLSQYGALEMSRRGVGYRDILAYYFTGVQVQQLGAAGPHPLVTEAPPRNATPPQAKTTRRRVGW